MTNKKLTIYYDGLCYLCSYEIEIYRRSKRVSALDFIDITAQGFVPQDHGLDPYEVHKQFHVKTSNGEILKGIQAFGEIWKILPEFKRFSFIFTSKLLRPLAQSGYYLFAIARPYLPRKKNVDNDCNNSLYCEIHKHEK